MCLPSDYFNELGNSESNEDKEAAPGEDTEDEVEDGPGGAEVVEVRAGGAEEAAEEPSAQDDGDNQEDKDEDALDEDEDHEAKLYFPGVLITGLKFLAVSGVVVFIVI